MPQAKFSIKEPQAEFLNHCKTYGFKDKSSMVREALNRFKRELEMENLKKSADLYAEIYETETELSELTESAIEGWPE